MTGAGKGPFGLPLIVVDQDPEWVAELTPFAQAMEAACREAGYPNATAHVAGSGVFVSGDVPPDVVEKAWEVCRGIA